MSSKSFADLGVSTAVRNALSQRGIDEPFAIQRAVIGDVLAGRDVLARSPTGSGKTLAFGIPMVDRIQAETRRPAALVLAPTRELATQIVEELRPIAHSRALKITAVYGGVGLIKQAEQAAKAHIVVATPGRLEDQLSRRAFTLGNVRMLVIDEADRMLDMGFKPALDRIVALCPSNRQTAFFSATLEGDAGHAARSYTTSPAFHECGPTERAASADVEHRFVAVTHESRLETLVSHLRAPRELALVFVRTKHGADKLVKKLQNNGIAAVAMHGNKTQRQRERALAEFESFSVDTLVATDVAARGIDVSGISHVFQFDPPHDTETYVHRTGRTGRAGAQGIAVSLVSPDQVKEINRMVGELGIETGLGAATGVGAGGFRRGDRAVESRSNDRPRTDRGRSDRSDRRASDRPTDRSDRRGSNQARSRPAHSPKPKPRSKHAGSHGRTEQSGPGKFKQSAPKSGSYRSSTAPGEARGNGPRKPGRARSGARPAR